MESKKFVDNQLRRRLSTLNDQFKGNETLTTKMIVVDGQEYKEVIERSQFSQVRGGLAMFFVMLI